MNAIIPQPQAIRYLRGDATDPIGASPKIIMHIVNNRGRWGAGFTAALSQRWVQAEAVYRAQEYYHLGEVALVHVSEDTIVANMCAQDGLPSSIRRVVVDYVALRRCLITVTNRALEARATVHCPRIGCGLGGGKWSVVEALIQQHMSTRGVKVTVYDL